MGRTLLLIVLGVAALGRDAATQVPAPARPITATMERLAGEANFRARVEVDDVWRLPPAWHLTGPKALRPGGGTSYHREFLTAVTPEAFRTGTLYPIGAGVDPGALLDDLKAAWRRDKERRVRARIQKEVEALR